MDTASTGHGFFLYNLDLNVDPYIISLLFQVLGLLLGYYYKQWDVMCVLRPFWSHPAPMHQGSQQEGNLHQGLTYGRKPRANVHSI